MLNKSKELKAERGYTDPKSFVRLDGSEVLHGKDWKKRRKELESRSAKYCEWILVPYLQRVEATGSEFSALQPCVSLPDDAHHVIRRWPKRIDNLDNLLALCRYHHDLLDKRKPRWSKKGAAA